MVVLQIARFMSQLTFRRKKIRILSLEMQIQAHHLRMCGTAREAVLSVIMPSHLLRVER